MEKDELIDIWNAGNESLYKDKTMDMDAVEKLISKRNVDSTRPVYFNLIFYFLLQITNIALIAINLTAYKNNPTVFWSLIGMMAFSTGSLLYGIFLFYKFLEINKYSDTLVNLIDKQLKYFRTYYEYWLLIIAFSTLVLIFNVNIIVDYNDGYYYIHHTNLYIIVNISIFLFIYGIQKFTTLFYTKNLKTYLNVLKNGILDEVSTLERRRKKYRWIWYVLLVVLLIVFILGILKFQHFKF